MRRASLKFWMDKADDISFSFHAILSTCICYMIIEQILKRAWIGKRMRSGGIRWSSSWVESDVKFAYLFLFNCISDGLCNHIWTYMHNLMWINNSCTQFLEFQRFFFDIRYKFSPILRCGRRGFWEWRWKGVL